MRSTSTKDVESEALSGLLDKWDVEFTHDPGATTVTAEEVGTADLIGGAGELVSDGGEDLSGVSRA